MAPRCSPTPANTAPLVTSAPLELEVQPLLVKAEPADATPLQDGLTIPGEITRRQERKAALAPARVEIEAHARYTIPPAEHQQKLAARGEREERGEKVRGQLPAAPSPTPAPKDQYNFTDPESRIMKAGNGPHFEQTYNAQAAVEVESRLIVGERVSQAPNDKQELGPTLAAIPAVAALVDSGFVSAAAVSQVGQLADGTPSGTVVYAPVAKTSQHRRVADLEVPSEPAPPPAGASVPTVLSYRLQTAAGKALYKLRPQTVEPVLGIIKSVLGFRPFRLRGQVKPELRSGIRFA